MKNLTQGTLAVFILVLVQVDATQAQQTVGPYAFTPNTQAAKFRGQATISGVAAKAEDVIAAVDEGGNVAGAAYIKVNAGVGYIDLTIYGDEPRTSADEGMDGSETFTLRLYDTSEGVEYESAQAFSGWTNTNGQPLSDYAEITTIYDFVTRVAAAPETVAATPTQPSSEVTSLFSDAYADVTVDSWSAEWDQADVEDIEIAGNALKKYTNLNYAGIEFTSSPIDASGHTHFRLDLWTPDEVTAGTVRVKLVDFGANGVFDGGDDTEHELTFDASSGLAARSWVSIDIALSSFAGLASRENLAQLIISGDPGTVYLDNVLFYGVASGTGTGVDDQLDRPAAFRLSPSYPNPFNPQTTIPYYVDRATKVNLSVYDQLGRRVATLVDGSVGPGHHEVLFIAGGLPSGTYYSVLRAAGSLTTRALTLIK
ncbi:MAG: hypothetical protein JJ896_03320 [Rhodothermales bacterium]|nr:hypothetical protein [Rhodothermales bacterium]MBO6778664.1 hypothetical protein [Rhodothermales bacterium]